MRKILFCYIVHLLINSSIIMCNQAQIEKNTNALQHLSEQLHNEHVAHSDDEATMNQKNVLGNGYTGKYYLIVSQSFFFFAKTNVYITNLLEFHSILLFSLFFFHRVTFATIRSFLQCIVKFFFYLFAEMEIHFSFFHQLGFVLGRCTGSSLVNFSIYYNIKV